MESGKPLGRSQFRFYTRARPAPSILLCLDLPILPRPLVVGREGKSQMLQLGFEFTVSTAVAMLMGEVSYTSVIEMALRFQPSWEIWTV